MQENQRGAVPQQATAATVQPQIGTVLTSSNTDLATPLGSGSHVYISSLKCLMILRVCPLHEASRFVLACFEEVVSQRC